MKTLRQRLARCWHARAMRIEAETKCAAYHATMQPPYAASFCKPCILIMHALHEPQVAVRDVLHAALQQTQLAFYSLILSLIGTLLCHLQFAEGDALQRGCNTTTTLRAMIA